MVSPFPLTNYDSWTDNDRNLAVYQLAVMYPAISLATISSFGNSLLYTNLNNFTCLPFKVKSSYTVYDIGNDGMVTRRIGASDVNIISYDYDKNQIVLSDGKKLTFSNSSFDIKNNQPAFQVYTNQNGYSDPNSAWTYTYDIDGSGTLTIIQIDNDYYGHVRYYGM